MERGILALAVAGLLLTASAAATAGPPGPGGLALGHSQRVMASADAGVCSQAGDLWRCRQFSMSEYGEPTGAYRETVFRADQWRGWTNGYAYRHLECPVDRQALRVTPNRAVAQATVDAESPECINFGEWVTFDPDTGEPSFEPWPFVGLVTVDATLLDPTYQQTFVSNVSYKDNETGQSTRDTCNGGSSWRPNGGGVTLFGLYRAFGPGEADGSFYYDRCGTTAP